MRNRFHILEFIVALVVGLAAFFGLRFAGVILPVAILAGVFGFIAGFLFAQMQQKKRDARRGRR